jgi:hypothetical protein
MVESAHRTRQGIADAIAVSKLALLFALAACGGATPTQRVYSSARPSDPALIDVVTDRTALEEFDAAPFRCVMRLDGTSNGFTLGTSACGIADQDGDGRADFVIGAFNFVNAMPFMSLAGTSTSTQPGTILVMSATGREIGRVVAESSSDGLGMALQDLGDVDGDAVRDWAFGVPDMSLKSMAVSWLGKSRVSVVSGATGGELREITGSPGVVVFGNVPKRDGGLPPEVLICFWEDKASRSECTAHDLSGRASSRLIPTGEGTITRVIALDDVDGDGVGDLALSSDDPGGDRIGKVFFHSGRTGECFARIQGDQKYARFGLALCAISDVDGDNVGDLLVSEPSFGDCRGRVLCVSSASRRVLFEVRGWADQSEFGIEVASLGDIDGDGLTEVAIASSRGKDSPDPGRFVGVFRIDPVAGFRELARLPGRTVFALGDLDGDSHTEFATADYGWPKPLENRGRVWVFSRRSD